MTKVLHLSQTNIKYDSRILKEMLALDSSELDLQLFGIGAELENTTHKESDLNGLNILTINLLSRKLNSSFKFVRRFLSVFELTAKMFYQALKFKPAIIHCHDTAVLPLGVILKLFIKTKVIYDAHELESNRNELGQFTGYLVLLVEKLLWRYVEAIIVVSPSIKKWYLDNIGDKTAEVILNAPLLLNTNVPFDNNYLKKHFNIKNNAKVFIYIGGLQVGRGLDVLLEVFKKDDIESHIVFLGYGPLKGEILKTCNEFDNIHLHDAVSHDQVVKIAKSADVGLCFIQNVSLSDYYCLPNKLFEYGFSEIPVLASNFPDIADTVKKFNLGKCSDLEFDSIYGSIKEFELMKELPKIESEKLFELSWDAQKVKLKELYKQVLRKEV